MTPDERGAKLADNLREHAEKMGWTYHDLGRATLHLLADNIAMAPREAGPSIIKRISEAVARGFSLQSRRPA